MIWYTVKLLNQKNNIKIGAGIKIKMLRDVLNRKSSVGAAKRVYLSGCKLDTITAEAHNKGRMTAKESKWSPDDICSYLDPQEKVERMQRYTKSLQVRKAKYQLRNNEEDTEVQQTCAAPYSKANKLIILYEIYSQQLTSSWGKSAKRKSFLPPLSHTLKILQSHRCVEKRLRHLYEENELPERERIRCAAQHCQN